ncbi:MAG: hypothetical protein ACLP6E_09960 [Acidimicrobiales bacterium]
MAHGDALYAPGSDLEPSQWHMPHLVGTVSHGVSTEFREPVFMPHKVCCDDTSLKCHVS